MTHWNNKSVIITGGGSGIGKSAAAKFLKKGATVYINGRTEVKLKEACEGLRIISEKIDFIPGDVSKVSDCERIVKKVVSKEHRIDVVINSAGIWIEGPSDTMTEDLWNRCIDINLKGTFFMCRYAIPYLEKSQGCIINVSSDSGLVGNKEGAVYCASKGGVTLLTKSLAVELAERKIRVNAVCPGEVMTPMMEKALIDYGKGDAKTYYKQLLKESPENPCTFHNTRGGCRINLFSF
jgi:NAD(P)-dependent dehydrogenase (short-subunit alcohol dehydrogenase family)